MKETTAVSKPVTKQQAAKAQRRIIQKELSDAMAIYKPRIGDKKFESLVKKVSKTFVSAIRPARKASKKTRTEKAETQVSATTQTENSL